MLQYFNNFPPSDPSKPIEYIFFVLANFAASIKFLLFPEVEMNITQSFLFARDSNCLLKIFSNPRSFPAAVIKPEFDDKLIADKDFLLFFLNLTINSVTK